MLDLPAPLTRRKGFAEEEAIETSFPAPKHTGAFRVGKDSLRKKRLRLEPIWSARYRYWVGKDSLRKKRLRQSYLKMT